VLAGGSPIELALLPNFSEVPAFEETAPTFAENSAGKALHYSRFAAGTVLADDSGLVVPALGGAPRVMPVPERATVAGCRSYYGK